MPLPSGGSDVHIYTHICIPLARALCGVVSPNMVTAAGFVVSMFLARNVLLGGGIAAGLVLTCVRGILDLLDGSVARSCDQKTKLGVLLDISSDCAAVVAVSAAFSARVLDQPNVMYGTYVALATSTAIAVHMMAFTYEEFRRPDQMLSRMNKFQLFTHNNTILVWVVCFLALKLCLHVGVKVG